MTDDAQDRPAPRSLGRMLDAARGYVEGMRVGAILSGEGDVVNFLGWGTYDSYHPCPSLGGADNPRITLDSGDVVWGCECWWGPEEQIRARLEGKRVVAFRVRRNEAGSYTGAEEVPE